MAGGRRCASGVANARRADLRSSKLYQWRRDLAKPAVPSFAAQTVSAELKPIAAGEAVVLEFGEAVLRIAADAPPALIAAVVRTAQPMTQIRSDVRIWTATSCRDMFGLALRVQHGPKRNPHAGDLYIFCGRAAT